MRTIRPLPKSPALPLPRSKEAHISAAKARVSRQLTTLYTRLMPVALLRRAIDDADELARETGFPHLFFPALAEEKVRTVSNFLARDQPVPLPHALASAA